MVLKKETSLEQRLGVSSSTRPSMKPQKWHTWLYLGAGLFLTGCAVSVAVSFNNMLGSSGAYGSIPLMVAAIPPYVRFVQLANHFYGRSHVGAIIEQH